MNMKNIHFFIVIKKLFHLTISLFMVVCYSFSIQAAADPLASPPPSNQPVVKQTGIQQTEIQQTGIQQKGIQQPTPKNYVAKLSAYPLMSPKLSSHYGFRIHPIKGFSSKHQGVDLAAPKRAHVFSVQDGIIRYAGPYAGYGNLVTIEHSTGSTSLYGHLSEIRVKLGQTVKAGQVIGRVGSTGHSTGPHLHFEWRIDGTPVDPLKIFPSLATGADG
jgi:murein DD-endopeptidase MepM/ murein hydrolase activator NlpD